MTVQNTEKLFLTIDELAEILGMSVSTIRRRIRSGEVPAYQFGRGKAIRIPRDFITKIGSSTYSRVPSSDSTSEKLSGPTPKWCRKK